MGHVRDQGIPLGVIEDPSARQSWSFTSEGQRFDYEVAVHPFPSRRILISMPGFDGHIDGYMEKYKTLAEYLIAVGLGAVLRSNNPLVDADYEESCVAQARAMVSQALAHSEALCGRFDPELYLMGYSAGASALATVAAEFPEVKRLLLIAPSEDAGEENMRRSLERFRGVVSVVYGDQDLVVGDFPAKVARWGLGLGERRLVRIPGCDHQFRGLRNGVIMSQAPLWAFADLLPFPHPEVGIKLYD